MIKDRKILNTNNEELQLSESDDESDEQITKPLFKNVFMDLIV